MHSPGAATWRQSGNKLWLHLRAVINTSNFGDSRSEPHKSAIHSWPIFATGNVATTATCWSAPALFGHGLPALWAGKTWKTG